MKEQDPYGKNKHEKGCKLDANKLYAGAILDFGRALFLVLEDYHLYVNDYMNINDISVLKSLSLENSNNMFLTSMTRTAIHCLINLEKNYLLKNPELNNKRQKDSLGLYLSLTEVAKVSTFGITKYSRGGWQHIENGIIRYTDALMRHIFCKFYEDITPDSQLLHDAHIAWNSLARLELKCREDENKEV